MKGATSFENLKNKNFGFLANCEVADVNNLWNKNFDAMAEDFVHREITETKSGSSSQSKYLPELSPEIIIEVLPKILLEELSYDVFSEDLAKSNTLNEISVYI
ncbi:10176_t:CDS:2 [Ambispora leptoticha]|uniref:10176_t:CDS:1 n=1 Tax=Ambispora leptoticha TaxID=144679 RepID=A0A9N9F5L6_9GLOM|nr:10176_t:CDS:2 [Ambispora leptoticha]